MSKVIRIVLDVLALAGIAGAYAIEYFTHAKLGMTRWVNYNTGKLCQAYPMETLRYVALAIFVIALVVVVARFVRKRSERDVVGWITMAVAVLLVAASSAVTFGAISVTAYYFALMALDAGCVFALLSAAVSLR